METDNTKTGPLLSVIVPVYNAERFLARTVGAIQAQTVRDLEILLVNDGSKDQSLSICRQLAEKDPRIRVFDKKNGGASSARNVGIANARGQYLGFVDADDWIYPDMYENLLAGAQKLVRMRAKDFLVQIGREEVNEQGEPLKDVVTPPEREDLLPPRDFAESLLLYTGDASFCTALLPADFMKAFRFPEGTTGEDFRLLMEMAAGEEGRGVTCVLRLPMRGYRVVHRAGSVTRTADNPSKFSRVYVDIIHHADWCETSLVERYPDLAAAARRFGLYERLDYLLHVPIADMNRENAFYRETVRYLRRHVRDSLFVPHLTGKNRIYLLLFTLAPRSVRKVHWSLRGKKILAEGKITA